MRAMATSVARAIAAATLVSVTVGLAVVPAALGQATNGSAAITPSGDVDPGQTITVSNASDTPRDLCTSTSERTISIDILTSTDRLVSGPHTGPVGSVDGTWNVQITLAADLAPGAYKALASCYNTDDTTGTKVRTYDPALFDIRQQSPGLPNVRPAEAMPGDPVQIGSGPAKCAPPKGASAPVVRASILDGGGNTRAEGEGGVLPDGSWSVNLKVPGEMTAQVGSVTASCLARVGASAPYARYGQAKFTIVEPPPPSTTSTLPPPSTTLAPGQTVPSTTVAPSTTIRGPVPKLPGFSEPLAPSPVAQPIIAEPTYTG
jgi:hypothetical protein